MGFLRFIFAPIVAIFRFINTYFKAMLFLLIVFLIFFSGKGESVNPPNLTQINLSGAIMDANEALEKIEAARKDGNIKGVLLYIDSPGGALAPSVELHLAVKNLRAKKPVVAYVGGSMTSGSYYAGAGADRILANPGAFIGSIGVIMQGADASELAAKIGVSQQVVKAGEYKEAGTFVRQWSKVEREQLQELVNASYEMFVSDVAADRNLDANKSKEWANARVFLASDAAKLGLIDEVSDYYSARAELEKLSGVAEPVWEKPSVYEKAMQKFINQGTNSLISAFFEAKAR
ncbi:signal peptide peptidase SppA [Campylobacter showae]|jgi:signal peptide peptidase sppA, 36K type|uniref:Protease IV (PspA) n=1 Tax=Campylobacter showae CSUNSWCD TaxID=1244083 RepID=M5IQ55_9BACT|nr:signal peptide peptidase SppA [Campylobacter showae]EKU10363.1 protease IV (PspA) [Campylobacter showae CSUNSWCD]